MTSSTQPTLKLHATVEHWPLSAPFRISQHAFTAVDVLVVTLESEGHTGRGEAVGVYYHGDTASSLMAQVEAKRAAIEAGVTIQSLQQLLPAGGARNAVDSALWDLEAKRAGEPAWRLAQLDAPRPLLTTFTCGADIPRAMASAARAYTDARALKLKLTGQSIDSERVRAVREARPDVWIGIDANQGFTPRILETLMPVLVEARIALIEQPFPIGSDALLDGFHSPIPIAADESAQTLADLPLLAGRFDVVNIKLDKCGGLTAALAMVRGARAAGIGAMIGNMFGTSLAMAPAFLAGQLCEIVDLDGPLFLRADRSFPARFADGSIMCSETLWGGAHDASARPGAD